jgi:hypothetical protein
LRLSASSGKSRLPSCCSSVWEVLSLLQVSFSIFTPCCHRLSNLPRNPAPKTHSSAKLLVQLPAIGAGGSYLRRSGQRRVAHPFEIPNRRVAHPLTGRILGFFGRICGCPTLLRFLQRVGVFGSSLPLFAPLLSFMHVVQFLAPEQVNSSHPSQTHRRVGHPQELRLAFRVIYPSGIILTEAPSIVKTTETKRRSMGHPP